MTSNTKDSDIRCRQQRGDPTGKHPNISEKRDSNDIVNRRHSLAHINFRRAIYRSLSLLEVDDESNHISKPYMKYVIQLFFVCLLIGLIGSLIRFMRLFPDHK